MLTRFSRVPEQLSDLRNLAKPLGISTTGLNRDSVGEDIISALRAEIQTATSTPVTGFFEFNAETYGAVGDGVTDDSVALQAAFNACVAAGEGNLFRIPPGTYKFSTPLNFLSATNRFNLDATGAVLKWTGSTTGPVVRVGCSTYGNYIDKGIIRGLDVVRDGAADWTKQEAGVELVNLYAYSIENVSVSWFTSGIVWDGEGYGCTYNKLTINRIRGCKYGMTARKVGGGWVSQITVIGGTWNPGTAMSPGAPPYDMFCHVFLPKSSSATFLFLYCSFEGGVYTAASSAYAFIDDVGSNYYCDCRYEFVLVSPYMHIDAYGVFGPNSGYSWVTDYSNDLTILDSGYHNLYDWLGERTFDYPTFYGRLGINAKNTASYGLYVAPVTGASVLAVAGNTNTVDDFTALSAYSGPGTALYAKSYGGLPFSIRRVTDEGTSAYAGIQLTRECVATPENRNGLYIEFKGQVIGSASERTVSRIISYLDDVNDGTRTGRLLFSTAGGSGSTPTVLQLSSIVSSGGATSVPAIGFFGATPAAKPTVTGLTDSTAFSSLVSGLEDIGLIVDDTTFGSVDHIYLPYTGTETESYKIRVGSYTSPNTIDGIVSATGYGYAGYFTAAASTGSIGVPMRIGFNSERTSSALTALEIINQTTVTPGNGLGSAITYKASAGTAGTSKTQAQTIVSWADSGATTYRGRTRFLQYYYNSAFVECLRLEALSLASSGAGIGFYGSNAVAKQTITATTTASGIHSVAQALGNLGLVTNSVAPSGLVLGVITVTPSGSYSPNGLDDVIKCSGTSTITLPPASGLVGKVFIIKNTGTETITINGTIDGSAYKTLTTQYEVLRVVADSAEWSVI